MLKLRCWNSDGTMRPNISGGDSAGLVAEYVAGNKVEDSQDKDKDAGSDDDPPECDAEGLLRCGFFIQIAQNVDAENDHSN